MKVIFASVLVAIVIAVAAGVILNSMQRPAYEVYSTSSTRIAEPGHNLVGENWSGNPSEPGKS